jgi:hypothetical protein
MKKSAVLMAVVVLFGLALPTFAQQSPVVTRGPIVIREFKHDTGPILREVAPLLPEFGTPSEHEIQNFDNPNHNWRNLTEPDPVLQTAENSPQVSAPGFDVEFEGLGVGDAFFCNCEPPDNDGAPGINQYTQYINLSYVVTDKIGTRTLGPLAGNSFWSGFGGSCQTDNSGDPIIRFDAAAGRWVVSQFAINSVAPDFECVAVSQTSDATGAYNRYAFSFNNFPDYPKMGVWPDAYYFTFNNFNIAGSAYVGANACAMDRSKMLTGAAATMVCFQQNSSQFGELPSDLDGPTPPAVGTPNFVMELDPSGSANLDLFKFHVDFAVPANSTFTGPTLIPVASFTPLCNGFQRGRCVPQPSTPGVDTLESLGNRVMYRLVYRNFGDHTTLLASHSIATGGVGGLRWYEMRNPETGLSIFQSGTFAPADSLWRWMPAIAMDKNQDIAIGYTTSGSGAGQFPSLVYTGRTPSDPAGTMETEVVLKAGLGSQTGGGHRWGDYSSMTIDPTDDCTFWFTEEYQKTNGGFDWSTAVGNFKFSGCGGGPDYSLTATPNSVTITQGSSGTSTITVVPVNGFSGNVTLSASGLPSGVTAGFSPNPTATTSTLTLTASATATTGTVTVTITGTSGSLSHQTTLSLTVNSSGGNPAVSLSPTSLNFKKVPIGQTSPSQKVTLTNTGTGTLNITSITTSGDFHISNNTCGATVAAGAQCAVSVTFTPTKKGKRTGNLTFTDNAANSPQTVPLSGTGVSIALSPTTVNFGTVHVGTTSPQQNITVTNVSSVTVSLTGFTLTGTAAGDYLISSNTCGGTLAAGANCSVGVEFKPTAFGKRNAKLNVKNNGGAAATASLTGTGN